MTTQIIRLKITSPALKLRSSLRLPTDIRGAEFITASRANSIFTIGADYTILDTTPLNDPTQTLIAIYDAVVKGYKAASLSTLLAEAGQIVQDITTPGPIAIANNAGIVLVEQAVGAAITLNLPAAANKSCPVLIADWKGDAGTNNITIVPNGAETIQGKAQWQIAGDNGSVFIRPIAGRGYAI